ncbi:MAG: dolichyl-phosphate beta-D-mannosyltransferase [Gammaproteobacteria bacterium]|nr:dolichyl-phosphate beta-D-mannosyltransferase [Gammaproteobacteria bacterium]|tara:strand:- start:245 stop:955 length:711 start_codon:yes stop_codon:yes gene_type:complete
MNKSKILVVTPTFNEIENIENFVKSVTNLSVDILIVDDNSPDNTAEKVASLMETNSNLYLLLREKKLGLGSAYRDGFKWAINRNYQKIIEMDADFSHRIEDLKKLIDFKEDYDVLIGSRYVFGGATLGWDYKRKMLSKLANRLSKLLIGGHIEDLTSGFRIYTNKGLKKINFTKLNSDGYSFQIEMTAAALRQNLNIKELPIIFEERRLGQSKMSFNIIFEAVQKIFSLFIQRFRA